VIVAFSLSCDVERSGHYLNRGAADFDQGKYEDAASNYRKAVELNPSYAAAHLGLGKALWKLGRREESIHHLRLAVKLNPEDEGAQRALSAAEEDRVTVDPSASP
jgi:tetratricopeptide (TPR) repeat protein